MKVFIKGMLMGTADVVPGISGGTLALIVGIYERLINALKNLSPQIIYKLICLLFSCIHKQGREVFLQEFKKIDGTSETRTAIVDEIKRQGIRRPDFNIQRNIAEKDKLMMYYHPT